MQRNDDFEQGNLAKRIAGSTLPHFLKSSIKKNLPGTSSMGQPANFQILFILLTVETSMAELALDADGALEMVTDFPYQIRRCETY